MRLSRVCLSILVLIIVTACQNSTVTTPVLPTPQVLETPAVFETPQPLPSETLIPWQPPHRFRSLA